MIKVTCRDRQYRIVAVFRGDPVIAMTSLYMNGDPRHVARYDHESNRWHLNLIQDSSAFATLTFEYES